MLFKKDCNNAERKGGFELYMAADVQFSDRLTKFQWGIDRNKLGKVFNLDVAGKQIFFEDHFNWADTEGGVTVCYMFHKKTHENPRNRPIDLESVFESVEKSKTLTLRQFFVKVSNTMFMFII